MLTGEAGQINVILDHHDVSHLAANVTTLLDPANTSLTVNMLFRPPPALVAIRVSTPTTFITLTGMAV